MWGLAAAVLLGVAQLAVGAALDDGFRNPPPSARPHTWWHWMNGNITKEGITADLEAMARVGIGGAQIFNVGDRGSVDIPAGPLDYMSVGWLEAVRHAAVEADRLGIELCFHNCAGWSSSGGPWITPEYAMQIVTVSETAVEGPSRFTEALPQPSTQLDYYRDIAVLAFPTPDAGDFRIADIGPKAGFESRYGMQPSLAAVPAGAAIPQDGVIDLSALLAPDGRLSWEVPAGQWTILRIGHTPTGKTNHPAPESGRGLECDKLSRQALDVHWEGGVAPVLEALGPLAGRSLNNILIDSYEVGSNNWTRGFREEFLLRRGYDPFPFLPALTGRVVVSGAETERFLWDYRRTIGDLFADNYFGYFAAKCRANGLLTSVEPYDGPFECLAVGAQADILMGEFWVGSHGHPSTKLAASTAHTHGQTVVGAESFTASPERGRWQNHPGSLKALGDSVWCTGVNRFIFHRYAHQPWLDVVPGMTMGQWGSHFDRTTTWWEPGRAWMTYLARSQFLLQQGRFAGDVLFFGGEAAPNGSVIREDLKAAGYDYDAIGTDLVPALRVRDRRITLPSGMAYRLFVLPDTPFMTPALARKVRALVMDGAVVLGPKPQHAPGLTDYPASEDEVRAIGDKVWGDCDGKAVKEHGYGKGRIFCGMSPQQVLEVLDIGPDLEVLTEGAGVEFIHRRAEDADLYFVAHGGPEAASMDIAFRVSDRQPELWDPMTGRIEDAARWRADGDRTVVMLDFDPAGSVFVVFRKPRTKDADPVVALEHEGATPLPAGRSTNRLEIVKAEYGVIAYSMPNTVDVTDQLAARVSDGSLHAVASNELAGDPAQNIVKSLWIEYRAGGVPHSARVRENQSLDLPRPGEAAGIEVVGAIYGVIPDELQNLPERTAIDITARVAAEVKAGALRIRADNDLAGRDPAYLVPKQLRVAYRLNGRPGAVMVAENQDLELPEKAWTPAPLRPRLAAGAEGLTLLAWQDGRYTLRTAAGSERVVEVAPLAPPRVLEGPWDVTFQAGRGAPDLAAFPQLVSWPEHEDPGIRYFSGTAVYRIDFDLPADELGEGKGVWLDLGRVEVMAEVKLNGRDLGVLWKNPFRVDLADATQVGQNVLEIRVTNLWPNRIIGDAQYPEDVEWNGKALAAWPDWFVKGEPRPVKERLTFTTWRHWYKDDALLPSGLIGPVRLLPTREVPVQFGEPIP